MSQQTPLWVTALVVAVPQVVIVAGFLIQNYLTRRREIEVRLTDRKQALALDFMNWRSTTTDAVKAQATVVTPASVAAFKKWSLESFLIASDEVVCEFQELERQLAEIQRLGESKVPYLQLGRVMMAIRRDTGNLRTKLGAREALRTFITAEQWDQVDTALRD